MHQFLGALGRKSSVVNLDAANDQLSYPCALDVFSLISLEDIMEHEGLGPNGGIIYALETLEANFEWLRDGLTKLGGICLLCSLLKTDDYILFDCPGQVELFTHHDSLKRIFKKLEKLDYRVPPECA
jgi:GTPase SAR1 family protein